MQPKSTASGELWAAVLEAGALEAGAGAIEAGALLACTLACTLE